MSIERQETKKPTCVGFFVEQNLLITLQVRRLEQQQAPLRQQVLKQAQLRQQVPVQLQEPEQQPEPELRFCYRRLRTGPTTQQSEQSISFIFPH